MITLAEKSHVIQNMSLIDRVLRVLIGAAMMGGAFYYYNAYGDLQALNVEAWGFYALAIAVYPLMTGMLGWDPFYAMFHLRSCSDSGKNPCGTFFYQWKSMTGHTPRYCESDAEHSLEACHDEPEEHPHHKVWRVDEEPMLYPDDRAWHRYFIRQQKRARK